MDRTVQTPSPVPATTWNPPPAWGAPAAPSPAAGTAQDLAALRWFKVASIVALVGAALGFLYPVVASVLGSFPLAAPTAGGTATIPESTVWGIFGIAAVGVLFSAVSYGFLRAGFARLRPLDRKFSSTPSFAVVAVVGFILVALGLLLLASGLISALRCAAGVTPLPTACVPVGTFLGAVGLIVLGGVVVLVGVIGTLVGIWRLGDRYEDGLFKAGAILLVLFGIVGSILLLVAVVRAEGLVRARADVWVAPPLTSSPFPPPPPHT